MLQFSHLQGDCNISHFISTREGGISRGEYAALNLGEYCGDDVEAVKVNREKLCKALSIPENHLFTPYQVHENKVVHIDESFLLMSSEVQKDVLRGIDALITNVPGVCVAVSTADCVPVLLYAPDKKVVAAIHAGWRGTVAQIVSKVVAELVGVLGCEPTLIKAGIGPSICCKHFEVGEEVAGQFRLIYSEKDNIITYSQQTGKPHIDLWEANRQQLLKSGLWSTNIEIAALCTCCNPTKFFSARRQGIKSGRMLSGIFLK